MTLIRRRDLRVYRTKVYWPDDLLFTKLTASNTPEPTSRVAVLLIGVASVCRAITSVGLPDSLAIIAGSRPSDVPFSSQQRHRQNALSLLGRNHKCPARQICAFRYCFEQRDGNRRLRFRHCFRDLH